MKKIIILAAVGLLAGCSAIPLQPDANKVLVSPKDPKDNCEYLGSVTGHQGNSFTGVWTTNANLEQGAMNDLKNKAAAMGANYVQVLTNRAATTTSGSFTDGSGSISSQQTDIVQVGNAYFCK